MEPSRPSAVVVVRLQNKAIVLIRETVAPLAVMVETRALAVTAGTEATTEIPESRQERPQPILGAVGGFLILLAGDRLSRGLSKTRGSR